MRKMLSMLTIVIGLVVGYGFTNEVRACDCEDECTFALEIMDEHIAIDDCTEEHTACIECEGYFCANLSCWCGKEVSECMTREELRMFDAMIWDMYLEEYCTNLCEECDSYYYKECMCDACSSDCMDCMAFDYELFIEDYIDMIIDEYEEVLQGIIDSRTAPKKQKVVVCYF